MPAMCVIYEPQNLSSALCVWYCNRGMFLGKTDCFVLHKPWIFNEKLARVAMRLNKEVARTLWRNIFSPVQRPELASAYLKTAIILFDHLLMDSIFFKFWGFYCELCTPSSRWDNCTCPGSQSIEDYIFTSWSAEISYVSAINWGTESHDIKKHKMMKKTKAFILRKTDWRLFCAR